LLCYLTNVLQIAVGGCEYHEPDDPGNLEFDWLEVQLKLFRQQGMQVYYMVILFSPFLTSLAGLDKWACITISKKLLSRMCQYPCNIVYKYNLIVFYEKYIRYVELSLRFQDTILGHLFGVS